MIKSLFSLYSITLLFVCFLNFSCTKIDTTTLGADLLPVVDNVNTFDTILNVIATNVDSVNKDCAQIYPVDDHILGYISNDPYFGTTTASIYTQLEPPYFPYKLPASAANMSLDSVVLVLSYKRLYGDSTIPQKVDVFQVSTPGFKFDSSSCTTQTHDPLLLGSVIYSPKTLKDSVQGFQDTSAGELRIRLSDVFGQSILQKDSSNAFLNDTTFKDFFSGFAIVPDISFGGNALTYFNLADTNTKLALYFKFNTDSKVDTTVINFRLTSTCPTANSVVRDHTGAEITNHLTNPPAGDDAIYIQTAPGTYANIKIPDLTSFPNRIIHRAELIMEQVYSGAPTDQYFTPPSVLFLETKNSDTSYRAIPCDFNISTGSPNFSTFGGFKTDAKDFAGNTISKYTFNISRYIQKIVTNRDTNYVLKLSAPEYINNTVGYLNECGQGISPYSFFTNFLTVGRIKLGGGNNSGYRMRLHIIYSNL